MYQMIEKLVNEGELTFAYHHRINPKYFFNENKPVFLEEIKRNLEWYQKPLHQGYCFSCGEHIDYTLEGNQLVPSDSACFNEKEIVMEIPVPSGELMFDDWFEHATPLLAHLDDKTFDINCTKVQVERTKDYEETGVAHFFVGGSYPRICLKDDVLYIGRGRALDEEENDRDVPIIEGGEVIGYVGTELRWTSICDYQIYEQMAIRKFGEKEGKKKAEETKKYADTVVKVEPGTYRITYYTEVKTDFELYAKIERVLVHE